MRLRFGFGIDRPMRSFHGSSIGAGHRCRPAFHLHLLLPLTLSLLLGLLLLVLFLLLLVENGLDELVMRLALRPIPRPRRPVLAPFQPSQLRSKMLILLVQFRKCLIERRLFLGDSGTRSFSRQSICFFALVIGRRAFDYAWCFLWLLLLLPRGPFTFTGFRASAFLWKQLFALAVLGFRRIVLVAVLVPGLSLDTLESCLSVDLLV